MGGLCPSNLKSGGAQAPPAPPIPPPMPGVRCTTSALVCTSCTRGGEENGAIRLVVLQTAEILGLIIYFAIHFLSVTIE